MDRFAKLRTDPFYRLMTLAATVVTVGLLVFCIVLVLLQQALIRVSGETVANAAANTAGRLDRVLFERMGDAEMMSRDFSGRTTDRSYLSAYLGWMNQAYPIYHWLAVLDPNGTVIATTEGEWQSQSRSSAEWFQRASGASHVIMLEAQTYPETKGEMAVGFASVIRGQDGQLQGFVASFVTLRVLEESYLEMSKVVQWLGNADVPVEYIVVNRDGLALIDSVHHQEGRMNLSSLPSVKRLWETEGWGFVAEHGLRDGTELITGYARTRGYRGGANPEWGVLVRVHRTHILGSVSRVIRLVAVGGLIVVALLVGLLFAMMARLRREMGKVRESQEELEQRVAERTREVVDKQQQLIQTSKLASLGQLSAGIAHELNNPLNNIGLLVFNAIDQVEHGLKGRQLQDPLHAKLDAALAQVERAGRIIQNLRTFARASGTTMGPVVLAEVIQASVGLLSEPLRLGAIEVSVNLEDPAAEAWGNTLQLEQVLVNLLTNAKDAVARTAVKRITITVHPDHEWQVITVTDTGQGMTDDTLLHIFDPFYTTKEVGVGTGLGLSIVYGIIKDHGGHISAQSRPGDGASFEIRLPRNAPTEDSATAPLAMRQE